MNLKISNVTLREAAHSYVLLTAVDNQQNEIVIELSHEQAEFLEDELYEANRRRRENAAAATHQDMAQHMQGTPNIAPSAQQNPQFGEALRVNQEFGAVLGTNHEIARVVRPERRLMQPNAQMPYPNAQLAQTMQANAEFGDYTSFMQANPEFVRRMQANPELAPGNF
jgi:hypothetical protein